MKKTCVRIEILSLFILSILAIPCRGDTLRERIQSDGQTLEAYNELTEGAKQIINEVERRFQTSGKMPSYPEYLDILTSPGPSLSNTDPLNLFTVFGRIQRPIINKSDLADLIRAQRASLTSFRVKYSIDHLIEARARNTEPIGKLRCDCTFAFDGTKVLYSQTEYRNDKLQQYSVESYDDRVLRTNSIRQGSLDYGTISHLDRRERFYEAGNPLYCSKLLDSQIDLQTHQPFNDLAAIVKSVFVYETQVDVMGLTCLVIGSEDIQIYCSVDHGFSLVKARTGGLHLNNSSKRYVRNTTYSELINSDLEKIGNTMWLPRRCEFLWTKDGQVKKHYVTTVREYNINPSLPDSFFTEVISKNAFVTDAIQNVTYILGKANVENALQNTVPSPISSRRRMIWLLMLNIIAFIIFIFVIISRKRRKLSSPLSRE